MGPTPAVDDCVGVGEGQSDSTAAELGELHADDGNVLDIILQVVYLRNERREMRWSCGDVTEKIRHFCVGVGLYEEDAFRVAVELETGAGEPPETAG